MSNREAHSGAPSVRAAATALLWAAVVLAGSSVVLRVGDALPSAWRGTARGVRSYETLPDLERAASRRLPVPAYYPSTLEWPPSVQRAYLERWAAYWCRLRADGRVALVVATAAPSGQPIAREVLPPAVVLQQVDGAMHGHPARVTRLRDADGALWQQIEWTGPRSMFLMRYRGTLDELMRMATSMNE